MQQNLRIAWNLAFKDKVVFSCKFSRVNDRGADIDGMATNMGAIFSTHDQFKTQRGRVLSSSSNELP